MILVWNYPDLKIWNCLDCGRIYLESPTLESFIAGTWYLPEQNQREGV